MERSSQLKNFSRSKTSDLGTAIFSHCPESLLLQKDFQIDAMKLQHCQPDRNGNISLKYHARPQPNLVNIDFEIANHIFTKEPELFYSLLDKNPGIERRGELFILLAGSTLTPKEPGMPKMIMFFKYDPKTSSLEFGTIGCSYSGRIRNVYKLVYCLETAAHCLTAGNAPRQMVA